MYKNLAKRLRATTNAIAKLVRNFLMEVKAKSPILLSQYWINEQFNSAQNIYFRIIYFSDLTYNIYFLFKIQI